MTAESATCVSSLGAPKKPYPSAAAARRDIAHSHRWRRRSDWPVPYHCPECHAYHLARVKK